MAASQQKFGRHMSLNLGEMTVASFSPELCVVQYGGSDIGFYAAVAIACEAILLPLSTHSVPFLREHLSYTPWLSVILVVVALFMYSFFQGEAGSLTLSRESGEMIVHSQNCFVLRATRRFPLTICRRAVGRLTGQTKNQLLVTLDHAYPVYLGRQTRAGGRIEAAKAINLWLDQYRQDLLRQQPEILAQ